MLQKSLKLETKHNIPKPLERSERILIKKFTAISSYIKKKSEKSQRISDGPMVLKNNTMTNQ